ncbi:unnamed protein product [Adineta steineri]|uniref:G-protein coupled receptors family 1 profile domain-containing protein n=2 Tax=Adineta steineri TaxID=433720 RepID=A0A814CME7_9BILA|nr:unnamed protein product [Adineta steineri]CAF1096746.1 unnamed protein product [Adineta steineri]CAF3604871.1 unnamed protein product [Adineta steineri]
MPMSYYYLNYIWPATNGYCVWWTYCEYSLNAAGLFLTAWISVERHLLIFHAHRVFRKRWKKWIFHFIPIVFCLIWAPVFYFVIVVISPWCTNLWDFNRILCGFPCYYGIEALNQFVFLFAIILPIVTIILANITLVIRVIYQKMSRQQGVNWRRHRKMVLQLLIISSFHLAIWLPLVSTLLIEMTVQPSFMINQLETMQFAPYFIPLFLPMICLSSQPELISKIKNLIRMRPMNRVSGVTYNRNAVRPLTIATVR